MVRFFSTVLSAIFHFLVAKLVSFALTLWRLHVTANKTLAKQGVSGPKPSSWITGNAAEIRDSARQTSSQDMDSINHHLVPRLLPFEHKNSAIYGKRFLAWTVGWEPAVNIAEPQLIQQVLTSAEFEKSGIQNKFMSALFGKGIIMATGKEWEHQRKLVTPAFYADKIKEMQEIMNSCAGDLVDRWTQLIKKDQTEIDAYIEFNSVSAEIIARTAFGNKYEKKDEYVYLEHELQDAVMKQSPFSLIPGYSYLPTRGNKRIWKLNKRIRTCLEELIEIRLKKAGGDPDLLGNDILGLLLAAVTTPKNKTMKLNMSKELLIDECKCFFFAGHETTASLLTWCTMFLALHPEWQTRAREEVRQQVEGLPTSQSLSRLKIVRCILSETLRLYPAAIRLRRKARKDTRLGDDLLIPKDVSVNLSILSVHHDTEIWGADALEFKPERFLEANQSPGSYLPFGAGPRVCIGRSLALTEAKTILCMLLQRFQWKLSANYRHSPQASTAVFPKHGMQLIVSNNSSEA